MDNIIEVKGITKIFKDTKVLDNVSISFERNKIHGIIGRNGSGKTVLIKTICGFYKPESGEVVVDGKVIGKDIDFPSNVGAIIEAPGFIPTLSGYKNLCYLASIKNRIDKSQIMDVMRSVGLDPNNHKSVGKYSLGMKQRLGIAQAMMEEPDILILDEPMNSLDSEGVEMVRKLLQDYRSKGHTVILISHNREDIDALCDTVSVMERGRVYHE